MGHSLWVAAGLLCLERLFYVWVSNDSARFARIASRRGSDPTDALRRCFYGFKGLQLAVFWGWLVAFSGWDFWRPTESAIALVSGGLLIGIGQTLNLGVFRRLGRTGVFYGSHFGHEVAWCERFPFSVLRHPQYVGTVLSIWGFFLAMRFPAPDWIVLPLVESAYYLLGTYLEGEPHARPIRREPAASPSTPETIFARRE